MTKIFLFPGQGSQKVGMGKELFPLFPDFVEQADEILGYSIEKLCIEDLEGNLNQTQYTQPALFVVNALSYFKKIEDGNDKPNFVAGHSLGEYNALFAGNVFDFQTGLRLVQRRGELMSKIKGGGMAAVIGLEAEQIKMILRDGSLDTIDIANYNAPNQIVISGLEHDISLAENVLKQNGAKLFIRLSVSGAFHSRQMKDAQGKFADFAKHFEFRKPEIPVISNYTALPYSEEIIENLTNQISNSVRWTETIQYLLKQDNAEFEEIGPGVILGGLLRKIKQAAR